MIFTIFPEKIYEKMGWKYGITSETTITGISSETTIPGIFFFFFLNFRMSMIL